MKICRHRTCSFAGEPQPLTSFYRNKATPDGLGTYCKACHNRYSTAYDASHPDNVKARQDKYHQSEYGRERRKQYTQSEAFRLSQQRYRASEKGKAKYARYRQSRPDHESARGAVNYAIKTGKLPPVASMPCQSCGKPSDAYHHHAGYDRKHWLDVIPVCQACHVAMDLAS